MPVPTKSAPGFRRPVLVVQSDSFNRRRIATVVCVPLTSNMKLALMPGNVHLGARSTGLPKNSVANVSQLFTVDKSLLSERAGRLPASKLELVFAGIELVLGTKRP